MAATVADGAQRWRDRHPVRDAEDEAAEATARRRRFSEAAARRRAAKITDGDPSGDIVNLGGDAA